MQLLFFCLFSQAVCHSLLVIPARSQSFDIMQSAISKHLVNILSFVCVCFK